MTFTVPETSILPGLPLVALRKTTLTSVERRPFSSMRLGVLSAGTSLKTGARSRFEIFMLRRAESVVPKGCVEPVAKIGVPLSFMESLGVTRLLLELASVLTNGSSRLKSVTDWSMARARSRT